jgi:hypothetical protein
MAMTRDEIIERITTADGNDKLANLVLDAMRLKVTADALSLIDSELTVDELIQETISKRIQALRNARTFIENTPPETREQWLAARGEQVSALKLLGGGQ